MKGIWYQILEQLGISLPTTKTPHLHSHRSDLSQNMVKKVFIKCFIFILKAGSLKSGLALLIVKLCQLNKGSENLFRKTFDVQLLGKVNFSGI